MLHLGPGPGPGVLVASLLATAACGRLLGLDEKEYDPALAAAGGTSPGGQAGAGAGGGAGGKSGSSGQGAGASGATGGGGAGGLAGAGGKSGSSGYGGATAGSPPGGAAGVAGSGGMSGAGPQPCMAPAQCPPPSDPCSRAACAQGLCTTEPDPGHTPAQTAGDCRARVCQGGATVLVDDPGDPPAPAGECASATCMNGTPVMADDDALCSYGLLCQDAACVCPGCPSGPVTGAPATDCRFVSGTVVTSLNGGSTQSTLPRLVDGVLATTWTSSGGFPIQKPRLRFTPDKPTWMAGLTFHPDPDVDSPVQYTLSVKQAVTAGGGVQTFTKTASGMSGAPVTALFPTPALVELIDVELGASSDIKPLGLSEVTFLACPPVD